MKRTRYSGEQNIGILAEHDAGARCADLSLGIAMPRFSLGLRVVMEAIICDRVDNLLI